MLYAGHDVVAAMLVNRGDEYVRAGDVADGERYYGRALLVSRWNEAAASSYVFQAAKLSREIRQGAIGVATAFLDRNPDAWRIRRARALCYTASEQWPEAAADWRLVVGSPVADQYLGPQELARVAFFAALTAHEAGERDQVTPYVAIVAEADPKLAVILRRRLER